MSQTTWQDYSQGLWPGLELLSEDRREALLCKGDVSVGRILEPCLSPGSLQRYLS